MSGPIIISFSRSKGVNGKIICVIAYALAWMKTCLNPNFRFQTATVIELRFFMKKKKMKKKMKMKMKNL